MALVFVAAAVMSLSGSPSIAADPSVGQAGPAITGVSAYDITRTRAKVTWTLDVPATGQVEYGTTTDYGSQTTPELSFDYTTHIQGIFGLTSALPFAVISTLSSGRWIQPSPYHSFSL